MSEAVAKTSSNDKSGKMADTKPNCIGLFSYVRPALFLMAIEYGFAQQNFVTTIQSLDEQQLSFIDRCL